MASAELEAHPPRLSGSCGPQSAYSAVVQAVLGNTHGFEYVVAGRQLDWLFAEDHEDCVSVAGAGAVERLVAVPAEPTASPDRGG